MADPEGALEARLGAYRERVEAALDRLLPPQNIHPARLHEAMRYAALGGGKRLRPALVYAAGEAVGAPAETLDAPACAVELVHAYSLVHDDLPAMDDDDLRRGRPTCHRAFGEALAILAGDALHALAFQALAAAAAPEPAVRLRMVGLLAQAAGSRGMAGGQALDLEATGRTLDVAQVEDIHIHKTGALIRASVALGALAGSPVPDELLERLDHFGKVIGLAFQIRDDLLDVEGRPDETGKRSGQDRARDKPTYPAVVGLEAARERLDELVSEALATLEPLGPAAETLRGLALRLAYRRA